MLDNVDHIKAYWVSSTPKVAQSRSGSAPTTSDGTIVHETIYHAAGSTSPQGLTRESLDPDDSEKAGFFAGRARHPTTGSSKSSCAPPFPKGR